MFREAYEEYKTATADSRVYKAKAPAQAAQPETKGGAGASADAVPTEDNGKARKEKGTKAGVKK